MFYRDYFMFKRVPLKFPLVYFNSNIIEEYQKARIYCHELKSVSFQHPVLFYGATLKKINSSLPLAKYFYIGGHFSVTLSAIQRTLTPRKNYLVTSQAICTVAGCARLHFSPPQELASAPLAKPALG